jgi:hypothetical protein
MWSSRYSSQMLAKLEFSRLIFEKNQESNLNKIRPVRPELFHADWRSEERNRHNEAIVAFRIWRTSLKTLNCEAISTFSMILTTNSKYLPVQHLEFGISMKARRVLCEVRTETLCVK